MLLESLTTALQAMLPRVYLSREAAKPFVRLTVASRLHELYGYELVPEPISAATPKDLEAVLKRCMDTLACHIAVRATDGPVVAVCNALRGVCKAATKMLCQHGAVERLAAERELRDAMAAAHQAMAALESLPPSEVG